MCTQQIVLSSWLLSKFGVACLKVELCFPRLQFPVRSPRKRRRIGIRPMKTKCINFSLFYLSWTLELKFSREYLWKDHLARRAIILGANLDNVGNELYWWQIQVRLYQLWLFLRIILGVHIFFPVSLFLPWYCKKIAARISNKLLLICVCCYSCSEWIF